MYCVLFLCCFGYVVFDFVLCLYGFAVSALRSIVLFPFSVLHCFVVLFYFVMCLFCFVFILFCLLFCICCVLFRFVALFVLFDFALLYLFLFCFVLFLFLCCFVLFCFCFVLLETRLDAHSSVCVFT